MPASLRWAWWGLLAAALLTRLLGLGAAPLLPAEVDDALGALDAARSGAWPAETTSPLLLVGNTTLFLLFGASETVARLLPALAGAALVMLPFLWRHRLGEVGALAAAGLLLISPLTLFAARRVDGASFATLALGLLVTAVLPSGLPSRRRFWIVVAAVAVGGLGGPAFYDLLLAGALVLVLVPGLRAGLDGVPGGWRALLLGLGGALLISTAFGFRWSGWAGIADGAAAWLAEWAGARGGGLSSLGQVGLYEPLLLILVVTATVMWARDRRQPLLLSLLLWGVLVLLLNAVRPGSAPTTLSAAVLPLALAAGWAIGALVTDLTGETKRWVGLHSLTAFVFWLPAWVSLAQIAGRPAAFQPALLLLGLGVLVFLQVLLVMVLVLRLAMASAWRGALLGFCGVVLLVQASFAVGLAFVRPASPVEPAIKASASPDLRHLTGMLQDLAVQRNVRADALDVVILDRDAELSALLRWSLRDFDELEVRPDWPENAASAVITPESAASLDPGNPEVWRGMSFVAVTRYSGDVPRCQSEPFDCSNALRWYLYRTSPTLPTAENVILWQIQELVSW